MIMIYPFFNANLTYGVLLQGKSKRACPYGSSGGSRPVGYRSISVIWRARQRQWSSLLPKYICDLKSQTEAVDQSATEVYLWFEEPDRGSGPARERAHMEVAAAADQSATEVYLWFEEPDRGSGPTLWSLIGWIVSPNIPLAGQESCPLVKFCHRNRLYE